MNFHEVATILLTVSITTSMGDRGSRDRDGPSSVNQKPGLIPTTGKFWPPYPFAEQEYWARESGFYGPIPIQLRDLSLLTFISHNRASKDSDAMEKMHSAEEYPTYYKKPMTDNPMKYGVLVREPMSKDTMKHEQKPREIANPYFPGAKKPSLRFYSSKKEIGSLMDSSLISPGQTYYKSYDLQEGTKQVYLHKDDVFYDKHKYPYYYKTL